MKHMKLFIVEDDPIIAADLKGILDDLGYNVCGVSHQPFEAKKRIESEKPDILLLDVNLSSEIDGIDLATLVKNVGAGIIFITAFSDKATRDRVKDLNPLGYILKPFDEKDIEVALDLALHQFRNQANFHRENDATAESIFIKTGNNSSRKIVFDDISILEACDNYAFIHVGDEKIMVSFTLKDLEQKIIAPFLVRVHRSYVVNTNKVQSIRNGVLVIGKHEIPIGKSYKDEVMKVFPTL